MSKFNKNEKSELKVATQSKCVTVTIYLQLPLGSIGLVTLSNK